MIEVIPFKYSCINIFFVIVFLQLSMLKLFNSNIFNENTYNVNISDNLEIALELLSNE
jgi:hypothetical protein